MPLQCRAVQFTEITEVNSGPKDRVGGLMLPSTSERLLAAASLCSSGHGHVPRASSGRDVQQSPGQEHLVRSLLHFSASGKAILFPLLCKRGD